MIRRSFRVGVTLGLLGGLVFALVKMLGTRSSSPAGPDVPTGEPWPRLQPDRPAPEPVLATTPPVAAAPTPAVAEEPVGPAAAVEPAPVAPAPAKRAPAKKRAPLKAWVEPTGGVCPTSHPIKAKLASKIFHRPGMLNYERTNPDRCYLNDAAAEADGLRAAKR